MKKCEETSRNNISSENQAFEKGRELGRLEGMITYQKHLIENMQKENVMLTEKLNTLNKVSTETVVDLKYKTKGGG